MHRKKRWVGVVILLALSCIIFTDSEAVSKDVAKVNGVAIEDVRLEAAVNNFIENKKLLGINIKEEDKEKLRNDILEELISAELLYQKSKGAGLGDLSDEVNRQFENIKKGFGSEKAFKDLLEQRGITEESLKKDIRKGVYIKAFLDKELYSKITITEDEKRQEYENKKDMFNVPEQVRASHILVRLAPDASVEEKERARKKIEQLRKRAMSGEDFAELARENSEDGSAPRGGDLGYFKRGDTVKPFEDAAFSLKKGEISNIIETGYGYHIIKLIDKRMPRKLSYEEVEKDIERFLLNRRKIEELNTFVDGLRKSAKIERY